MLFIPVGPKDVEVPHCIALPRAGALIFLTLDVNSRCLGDVNGTTKARDVECEMTLDNSIGNPMDEDAGTESGLLP